MNIFHIKIKYFFAIFIVGFIFSAPVSGHRNLRCVEFIPQIAPQNGAKNAHYLYKTGNYSKALDEYLKLPDQYFDDAEINFNIGICYLKTFPREQSLRYLQKAWLIDSTAFDSHAYYLGYAYQVNYEFSKAIEYYLYHLENEKPAKLQAEKVKKHIEECDNAMTIMGDTIDIDIKNAGEGINSQAPEYRPIPYRDETILFTSRRKNAIYEMPDPDDHYFYEKVFVANTSKSGTTVNQATDKDNLNHASLLYLSNDNIALFYTHYRGSGNIRLGEFKNGIVKEQDDLEAINSRFNETSAVLSRNGDTIYFISDRRDMGQGGRDIYFAVKRENHQQWTSPVNLGNEINSKYDEDGVSLSPDGTTLYFSSKGHNTMGGFDIFKVKRMPDGQWGEVKNLGFPVNSPLDDVFFVHAESNKAYFSSNRGVSMGDFDIFYADDIKPKPKTVAPPIPVEPIAIEEDTVILPVENENKSTQGQFTDISIEITSDDPDSKDNVNVKLQENKELKIFLPLNEKGEIDVVIEEFKENGKN